jgi:hypothetical protein
MLEAYILILALLTLTYFSNRYINSKPNVRDISEDLDQHISREFKRPRKIPHAVPNGLRS